MQDTGSGHGETLVGRRLTNLSQITSNGFITQFYVEITRPQSLAKVYSVCLSSFHPISTMVAITPIPLRIVVRSPPSTRSLESDEGSTIPTTPRKRRSVQRQVRFADSPTSTKVSVMYVLIPTRSEINAEEVYYSRQELRKMWNRARKNADRINEVQGAIAKNLDNVFEAAAAIEPSPLSFQGLSDLYDSCSRGVERLISDYMTEQRKTAIKRILEVQANTPAGEKRCSLMRMRSMLVSKKARVFAERLGASDCAAARKH